VNFENKASNIELFHRLLEECNINRYQQEVIEADMLGRTSVSISHDDWLQIVIDAYVTSFCRRPCSRTDESASLCKPCARLKQFLEAEVGKANLEREALEMFQLATEKKEESKMPLAPVLEFGRRKTDAPDQK
jgi:hypothetical protein